MREHEVASALGQLIDVLSAGLGPVGRDLLAAESELGHAFVESLGQHLPVCGRFVAEQHSIGW